MEDVTMNKELGKLSKDITVLKSLSLKIESAQESLSENILEFKESQQEYEENIQEKLNTYSDSSENKFNQITQKLEKLNKKYEDLFEAIEDLGSSGVKSLNQPRHNYRLFTALILSGGIIASLVLWLVFPQTIHQTYEFSQEQRRAMEHGALLSYTLPKLSQKDQDKIMGLMGDSWKDYYEDKFKIKIINKSSH